MTPVDERSLPWTTAPNIQFALRRACAHLGRQRHKCLNQSIVNWRHTRASRGRRELRTLADMP